VSKSSEKEGWISCKIVSKWRHGPRILSQVKYKTIFSKELYK